MGTRKLYPIPLNKGLDPADTPTLNSKYLLKSDGAFVREGVLRNDFVPFYANPTIYGTFPYMQIFSLSQHLIVCLQDQIWERDDKSSTWGQKLNLIPAGYTWNVIDRGDFLYLSNGRVAVIRDAGTGQYSITTDYPAAACMCDPNKQVLIGGPVDNS